MKTMTQGKIPGQLLVFAIPLIIGNILQQLYNTIDSYFIGKFVGENSFAAIGVASTIMNIFMFIIVGLCIGASILMAQLYGAGNEEDYKKEFFTALFFGSIFTIAFSILGIIFMRSILHLIQTPAEIFDDANLYLVTIVSGLIFTFFYNIYAAAFRSIGDSKPALMFLIISTIIHILLDLLFVVNLQMGVFGVAFATVLSQVLSVVLCVVYSYKKYPILKLSKKNMVVDMGMLKATMQYSFVTASQQSSLYIGKLLVQSAINPLGAGVIAAYAAVTRIEALILASGDGIADAITVFVAQNLGAKEFKRMYKGFFTGFKMIFAYSVTASLLLFVFRQPFIELFISPEKVQTIAVGMDYFKFMVFFYCIGQIGSSFQGFFRGVGQIKTTFWGTTIQISIRAIISYMLASTLSLNGVAIATGIGWACCVTYQNIMYRRYKKKNALIENEEHLAASIDDKQVETI